MGSLREGKEGTLVCLVSTGNGGGMWGKWTDSIGKREYKTEMRMVIGSAPSS